MSEKFGKEFWEDHYERNAGGGPRRPTPHLQDVAKDLRPGVALDAGCGEGADAVWLAESGWRVTAVDLSRVALNHARSSTAGTPIGQRIDWIEADLARWTPPPEHFDLVSAQYVHVPTAVRNTVLDALADAVAPGGMLLVGDHHAGDHSAHDHAEMLMAEIVAERLDPEGWDIDLKPVSHMNAGSYRHAHAAPDVVLRARRMG